MLTLPAPPKRKVSNNILKFGSLFISWLRLNWDAPLQILCHQSTYLTSETSVPLVVPNATEDEI